MTLRDAVAAVVAARPGLAFMDLCDAVRNLCVDAGAAEVDEAARTLGLERGKPGAYAYWPAESTDAPEDIERAYLVERERERGIVLLERDGLAVDGADPVGVSHAGRRPTQPPIDERSGALGERRDGDRIRAQAAGVVDGPRRRPGAREADGHGDDADARREAAKSDHGPWGLLYRRTAARLEADAHELAEAEEELRWLASL